MDHSASLATFPIRRLRRRAEVLTVGIITAFILCFTEADLFREREPRPCELAGLQL